MFYIHIDYPDIDNSSLVEFLKRCSEKQFPVIVEIQSWDFWKWLKEHKENNIWLSPDYPTMTEIQRWKTNDSREMLSEQLTTKQTYLQYYPDFSNPSTKLEYHRRFKAILTFLSPYFHNPIIAFSIGAYDNYHLPDGTRHRFWPTVVPHPKGDKNQTWIPYGPFVEKEYRSWLNEQGIDAKVVGYHNIDEVQLPKDIEQAKNFEHWRSWILYRRNYVLQWWQDTYKLVRSASGLPVTMTYDLNFSLHERFGTPTPNAVKTYDFLILYLYRNDINTNSEIAVRLRGISHLLKKYQKPAILMFEFTSQVSPVKTSPECMLTEGSPYVSGYQFHCFEIQGEDKSLYKGFISKIKDIKSNNKWTDSPPETQTAIFLNPKEIFLWDQSYILGKELISKNECYDVIYNTKDAESYQKIYIPITNAESSAYSDLKQKIDQFQKEGKEIIIKELSQGMTLGRKKYD